MYETMPCRDVDVLGVQRMQIATAMERRRPVN
jgi:hypothetical protein